MADEYYGATRKVEIEVSRLVGLPATLEEQDWEFIYADPTRIEIMVDLLSSAQLSTDERSALCSLMIASFEKAFDGGEVNHELMDRAAQLIGADPVVLERMRFFWLGQGMSFHQDLTQRLLRIT